MVPAAFSNFSFPGPSSSLVLFEKSFLNLLKHSFSFVLFFLAPKCVGSQFPDQRLNSHTLNRKAKFQPLDHQGSSFPSWFFFTIISFHGDKIQKIYNIPLVAFSSFIETVLYH